MRNEEWGMSVWSWNRFTEKIGSKRWEVRGKERGTRNEEWVPGPEYVYRKVKKIQDFKVSLQFYVNWSIIALSWVAPTLFRTSNMPAIVKIYAPSANG